MGAAGWGGAARQDIQGLLIALLPEIDLHRGGVYHRFGAFFGERRFGLGVVMTAGVNHGHQGFGPGGQRVLRPQGPLPDGQSPLRQGQGLLQVTLLLVNQGQHREAVGGLGRILPQDLFPDGQGLLGQGQGLVQGPHLPLQFRQIRSCFPRYPGGPAPGSFCGWPGSSPTAAWPGRTRRSRYRPSPDGIGPWRFPRYPVPVSPGWPGRAGIREWLAAAAGGPCGCSPGAPGRRQF